MPATRDSTTRNTTDTPTPTDDEATDDEATDDEATGDDDGSGDDRGGDDRSGDEDHGDDDGSDDDGSDEDRGDDGSGEDRGDDGSGEDRGDDDGSDEDRGDEDRDDDGSDDDGSDDDGNDEDRGDDGSDEDRGDDDRGDEDRGDDGSDEDRGDDDRGNEDRNTLSGPGSDPESDAERSRSTGSTTARNTDPGSSASSAGHPSPPSTPGSRNPQDPGCANPPGQQPTDRRAATPETTPPATPAARPGDVLDLRNWNLTLPTGAAGDPDTVLQPNLATYNSPHFALNDTGDGVVFTAPVDGTTTKNSRYARSELREMNGSEDAAWSNTSGVHTLVATQAVTQLPETKPEAVTAQIHDGTDDVLQIRLEGQRLLVQYNDGNQQVDLDPHYTLGARYTVTLTAAEGRVQVRYNDQPPIDLPLSGNGWYFKTGAYVQSNTTTGDRPPASAQVVIYSVATTHNDNNDTGLPDTSSDRPTPSTPTTSAAPTPDPDPTRDDATGDQPVGDKTAGGNRGGGHPADDQVGGAGAGAPGVRPVTSRCTHSSSGSEVPAAQPGDTVCFTGELPDRWSSTRAAPATLPSPTRETARRPCPGSRHEPTTS